MVVCFVLGAFKVGEDCIASLKVILTVAPLASVVKVDGLITTLETVGGVLSNVTLPLPLVTDDPALPAKSL